MTTVLVLGGARSGKSAYAELLLQDRPRVTYVAPGTPPHRAGPARAEANRADSPGTGDDGSRDPDGQAGADRAAGAGGGADGVGADGVGGAGIETARVDTEEVDTEEVDTEEVDTEWLARIEAHRARRPAHWATHEGGDVAALVASADTAEALLLDCLGTWVTRLVDEAGAWDDPDAAHRCVEVQSARLVSALRGARADVVVVSNEVGLGVVPATRSGRLFRDLLGRTNRAVADACTHVALVVAGRVLDLSHSPRIAAAPTFGLRQPTAPLLDARAAAEAVGALDSGIDVWADAGFDFSDESADPSEKPDDESDGTAERQSVARGEPR